MNVQFETTTRLAVQLAELEDAGHPVLADEHVLLALCRSGGIASMALQKFATEKEIIEEVGALLGNPDWTKAE